MSFILNDNFLRIIVFISDGGKNAGVKMIFERQCVVLWGYYNTPVKYTVTNKV